MTLIAHETHAHGPGSDTLTLTYEDRFLRRKVLKTDAGADVLIDLAQTTSLEPGHVLVCQDGTRIEIAAAPEPCLEVRGDLARLAWHIGNRHTPCQIASDHLIIRQDHVLQDMLTRLGADLSDVTCPFTPEGGAYGMGRTHGHQH